ncbi:hypothetical protein BKA61DRAFT_192521 [Leptodontidium sp. MPI-SDFR-AT-0119]|nr:hypothetical protein BKA61DRAFT_192521 [Leptodontidium sp. MPI-SDFR-AT-0119]
MAAIEMASQYKTNFPIAWILTTAETRANEQAALGLTTEGPGLSPIPPMTPQIPVRESAPPAALFIQQAGLVGPIKSTSPTTVTTLGDHSEGNVPKERNMKRGGGGGSYATSTDANSTSNQSSKNSTIRGRFKRFLPSFKAGKPPFEPEPSTRDKRKANVASGQSDIQPLPSRQVLFTWPETPQKPVPASHQATSGLESVPEGSQMQLTEESLGMAAPPYGSAAVRRIQGAYSEEPMTAGTGISSRSSNYADVPSRLPALSPGYSPMT